MPELPVVTLWALLGVAAMTDIAARRIPNPLVAVGLLAGFAFSLLSGGASGLGHSVLGGVIPFVLLAPLWRMTEGRHLGAGDVKLFMVVGAFLWWQAALIVIAYAHVLNGVVAGFMILQRRFAPPAEDAPMRIPMAVGIFAGALLHTAFPDLLFTTSL